MPKREPFKICMPVMKDPFSQKECLIMGGNPVQETINGIVRIDRNHYNVIGIPNNGKPMTFTVTKKQWLEALKKPISLIEVPDILAPSGLVGDNSEPLKTG